jgi:hypothetical protein
LKAAQTLQFPTPDVAGGQRPPSARPPQAFQRALWRASMARVAVRLTRAELPRMAWVHVLACVVAAPYDGQRVAGRHVEWARAAKARFGVLTLRARENWCHPGTRLLAGGYRAHLRGVLVRLAVPISEHISTI